ncbi:hypothetical protein BDP27DRAFT_1366894 [Rhodocollybia butyracea]|uniref:Uncharacterized protein n=1 Tax=Rhodocollybia butyracea TaxID=206335 RepID=A0A9P5PKF5_9AGAR|nr:hypothetical protein BDP27DRAFT_1366894 [Rhodocollybia butyracea]
MSDSGGDSDEYLAPPPPRTRERQGPPPLPTDATFSQFSKEKVQQYIDLVLSGVGVDRAQYCCISPWGKYGNTFANFSAGEEGPWCELVWDIVKRLWPTGELWDIAKSMWSTVNDYGP